jgi:hypothetical protein
MAKSGFEMRFIYFQSPCFLIYVGLPFRDRERTPIPQAHLKKKINKTDQYWSCLLAQNFKGVWSWLELEGGGE